MDPETRLELIAALAADRGWDAVVLVGRSLLDHYYPADIFTGISGDPGPAYVVALRDALQRVAPSPLPLNMRITDDEPDRYRGDPAPET
jgi:hypothetical protein